MCHLRRLLLPQEGCGSSGRRRHSLRGSHLSGRIGQLVPGIAFEAEGFCRLSYAISTEKIEEGLSRIEDFINELK